MKKLGGVVTTGVAMAIGMTAMDMLPTHDQQKASASTDFEYTVTADVLNVRNQASTKGTIIGKVSKGTKLNVQEMMGNGWYKITYNGKTAYVSGDYVRKSPVDQGQSNLKPQGGVTYTVTASNLNVRASSSTASRVIGSVKQGTKLTVQQELSNGWYRISYNNRTGYVSGAYVKKSTSEPSKPTPPPTIPPVETGKNFEITNGDVNLRANASWSGKVLSVIKTGTQVKAERYNNDWYKVNHNGMTGYTPASHMKTISGTTPETTPPPVENEKYEYVVTASALNVRSGPSTSSAILGKVMKETKLDVTDSLIGWYKITYNGRVGYVANGHVKKVVVQTTTPPTEPSNPTNPPVSQLQNYVEIDLRKSANITASDIDSYIASYVSLTGKSSKLFGRGQEIINVAQKYDINELFFAALMVHESAHGTSYLAHYKNNLTGLYAFDNSAYDSAVRFGNVAESMDYAAKYVRVNYLNDGARYNNGPTLKGMNVKYSSDSSWHTKIAAHMEKIKAFDKGHYDREAVGATTVNASLNIPAYSDAFPTFTKAIANTSIKLTGGPTIQQGEQFTVLEKSNDFRLKVQTSAGVFWTVKLPMSNHISQFQIQNLLRVRNSNLGSVFVYQEANSSSAKVTTIANFAFVEAVLDTNNQKVVKNGFYAVKLNGQTVWIPTSFIDVVYG